MYFKSFIWRIPSIRYWMGMAYQTKKMCKTIIVFQENRKKTSLTNQNSEHDEL